MGERAAPIVCLWLCATAQRENPPPPHTHTRLLQKKVTPALGDVNLREYSKGTVLQLERKGYFIVDSAWNAAHPEAPIVLFAIPDGRLKKPAA